MEAQRPIPGPAFARPGRSSALVGRAQTGQSGHPARRPRCWVAARPVLGARTRGGTAGAVTGFGELQTAFLRWAGGAPSAPAPAAALPRANPEDLVTLPGVVVPVRRPPGAEPVDLYPYLLRILTAKVYDLAARPCIVSCVLPPCVIALNRLFSVLLGSLFSAPTAHACR